MRSFIVKTLARFIQKMKIVIIAIDFINKREKMQQNKSKKLKQLFMKL